MSNNQQPLVTISFPVYEGDDYVSDSINSVLAQDYENLEIIIIDDCGKTNAMQIVRDCIERFPKKRDIRILRQPHNMEQGPARNRSLDEAKGEYIFFMDADDTITENCISLMVSTILKEQVTFVEGCSRTLDGHIYTQNDSLHKQCVKGDRTLLDAIYHNQLKCAFYITNKLFNIEFLRKNNIRCISPHFDDFHHAFQVFCKATSCVVLPDITYKYTIRSGQITQTYKSNVTLATAEIVRNFVCLEYKELEDWEDSVTRERALLKCLKMGMPFIYKAYRSTHISKETAKSIAKDILSYPKLRKTDYSEFSKYEEKKHLYYRILQTFPLPIRLILFRCVNFTIYKKKGV